MLFSISWRNLWRHPTRSLAIITSVALGVLAGAFIVSLYYGMGNERVRIAIEEEVSHLQIHHPNFREDFEAVWNFQLDSVDAVLQRMPGLKARSLRSTAQGMLANAAGSSGIQINGINPASEIATRKLDQFIIRGAYFDSTKKNQVLVGKKLADRMKLTPGAKIVLTFLDHEQNIQASAFRICGIYETSNAPIDERNVYVDLFEFNQLLGIPGRGTEAAILLTGETEIPTAQAFLQQHFPGLEIETWHTISPETDLVMSSLDISSFIIIFIIVLALAFGIINTMLMAVLERTREIGMLMAIGMTKIRLFGMVVLETVLLTMVGCPVGFGLAWTLNKWLSETGIDLSAIAGNLMKGFGYGAIIYPDLPGFKVGQIVLTVFVTALLASVFPAWKALKMNPVQAIKR
ncbi:MAG: ABC transporter permease [Saprospiraceae bacterium]|nr:ABC transporter permease [Saprospiraceae bacterium]